MDKQRIYTELYVDLCMFQRRLHYFTFFFVLALSAGSHNQCDCAAIRGPQCQAKENQNRIDKTQKGDDDRRYPVGISVEMGISNAKRVT